MKKNNYYTIVFCAMFMFLASILKSQDLALASTANEKWHPIKVNEASGNVLNGVSFFSRDAICNDKKVVLIRLSNSNLKPASVNYLENGIEKSVTVMASSIMEGTCEVFTDANEKNSMKQLVYLKPVTEVDKATKNRILASLKVTIEN